MDENFENAVATYIAKYLKRHVVLKKLHENIQGKDYINQSELEQYVSEVYPSFSYKTLRAYMNRLIAWFRFTGLIDFESPEKIIIPKHAGREKGEVTIRRTRNVEGKALFLCNSGPDSVIELAARLCLQGELDKSVVLGQQFRNASQDLTALELASWHQRMLVPENQLISLRQDFYSESTCSEDYWFFKQKCQNLIAEISIKQKFLMLLYENLKDSVPLSEIPTKISVSLSRKWKPSSADRYTKAGIRWLEYFGVMQDLRDKLIGQGSLLDMLDDKKT